ncbi:hypothetical protein [Nocardiopsis baichengensis]|uniref:hypothetical protein n=1 Tax=Nocardiopsis baichengensis TaxID=280240 RepID=UPI0003473C36|nr:hypothetical protein [Nocardiopsis baichengensis]
MATLTRTRNLPTTRGPQDPRGLDARQNAELARLIRRLAAVRPEIIAAQPPPPASPEPVPDSVPEAVPEMFAPHLTRDDFPVPKQDRDLVAHLRALSLGRMRPGDRWPAHADDRFLARMRRPLLRHRIADFVRDRVRPVCTAVGALTLVCGPALILLTALGTTLPTP